MSSVPAHLPLVIRLSRARDVRTIQFGMASPSTSHFDPVARGPSPSRFLPVLPYLQRMNLALIDPFQLAQDSPDALTNDLRSGHATTLRFNRKGDYLASGRVDGKVVIWDMETMGVGMKLHGHFKQIQSLSWSRCGRYVLSASQDWRAILWDLSTSSRSRIVKFAAPVYMAELHPYNRNLFVVSLFEDHPYLVDITEPIPVKHKIPTTPLSDTGTLPKSESKQATTAAIFSTLGTHIITGTSKGYINILETSTRQIIHSTKISSGLISLLRLTSGGRQLLINSTDRIIRVINLPDLSLVASSTSPNATFASAPSPTDSPGPDPTTLLPENIHLETAHKFQDLVNRLRWNHAAFSPCTSTTSTGGADYVVASTYMRRSLYIWELSSNSLLRILENPLEPGIIEWHPSRPLLACTSIETGSIQIWGIEPQQKWSALAPDFTEVSENVEYVEREDEFDDYPAVEHERRREGREDEDVDVLTVESTVKSGDVGEEAVEKEEESFVLPMLFGADIGDSDGDDDLELVKMGVGTMRKKEVNEGKEYGDDGDDNSVAGAAKPRKRR